MKFFISILIIIHLFLLILTVSHLYTKINHPAIGFITNYYSAFTYTNRCFGFFAPNVGDDLKISMEMSNENEKMIYHFPRDNFDFRTRLYSLSGHFAEGNQVTVMDLFARSWGVKCLNDYPQMKKVDILVTQNVIPTMAQYRKGERIRKDFFYSTTIESN